MNVQKTGSLIAAIRKEQNRTQQDLANELGVSSAAVSKWERGIGFLLNENPNPPAMLGRME